MVTIKITGLGSANTPCEFSDHYVVEYDPTRLGVSPSGQVLECHLITSQDPDKARKFGLDEALEYWRQSFGLRDDGEPNRPLTSFTVEIS